MITQERLKELLSYDPETGSFRWKMRRGKCAKGSIVGSKHSGGYMEAQIEGNRVFLHRLAWQYYYGDLPEEQIDHINGDRSDNRISNLRLATQQQNSANMKKRPNNKSGLKGVVINKKNGSIMAFIHVSHKTRYLGTYQTAEQAHEAYMAAAQSAFGDFARGR